MGLMVGGVYIFEENLKLPKEVPMSEVSFWKLARVLETRDIDS